ncbi:hypothetical protein R6Q57_019702 [Mikania cordata]
MIRLWDLGQQRCVHSYVVHTDSVWALASTPNFSHVYSGGRDLSLYITNHATRESILLCTKDYPIQQLAMHDDGIRVATTDSSVHRWSVEGQNPQKLLQSGGSFVAGNLSFSRARISLEGSTPMSHLYYFSFLFVPLFREPTLSIDGIPGIVQYEILNNKRHVLTKDNADFVKLWEITTGVVIKDYGQVSFEKKKEELFEMVEVDGAPKNDGAVYPPFEFSTTSPPSIITEGSHNGPWRKKITEMDGSEDEKDLPGWVLECILHNQLPPREHTKCSFYLQPYEGSTIQSMTQGKLSAPRILKIHKVFSYVTDKLVLGTPLDSLCSDETFSLGQKPSVEILCNNQVLKPNTSLATVLPYIWKKPEDLVLSYRIVPGR